MEPMDVEPTLLVDDERELQHIIAVLNATPGCSGAGESKYTGPPRHQSHGCARASEQ